MIFNFLANPGGSTQQNDVELVHEIEAVIGKQLDEFECKEKEVLEDNITRVSVEDILGYYVYTEM